jgi:hypothetical protein
MTMKTLARANDKAEVLQRLAALRPDSIRRWGRMTPHQMVCHVTDAYRLMTGERKARRVRGTLPGPVVKWIALYVPLTWPRGIVTTPEFDQELGGTKPAEFGADLAALTTMLDEISRAPSGRFEGVAHPIFGPMSAAAWLRWGYLHADHHLRQFGL